MLLSPDQFDAVLGQLHPNRAVEQTSVSSGGMRRSPRVPVTTRLTLVPFATGAEGLAGFDFPVDRTGSLRIPLADPISVPIRDLSRGGIRFMMPRRVALDTPFVLLLPSQPGEQPLAIESTVTYWQPVRRELFAIGAQFVRALVPFRPVERAPLIMLPGFGGIDAAEQANLRTAG